MIDLLGTPMPIKTLSLWQPWASLIVAGFKRHETRHWPTRVRGRMAIHAAKKVDHIDAPNELCEFALGGENWARKVPTGAIVAVADLINCCPTEGLEVYHSDWLAGNFGPGRFAYRLNNVRPLREPIPYKGAQGFFNWTPPEDLESRLSPPVDHEAAADCWTDWAL
jgi:hypothetical protein